MRDYLSYLHTLLVGLRRDRAKPSTGVSGGGTTLTYAKGSFPRLFFILVSPETNNVINTTIFVTLKRNLDVWPST